jgi:hypothetical protein
MVDMVARSAAQVPRLDTPSKLQASCQKPSSIDLAAKLSATLQHIVQTTTRGRTLLTVYITNQAAQQQLATHLHTLV